MDLPESAIEIFNLAKIKYKEKNYDESSDLFSRALEKKTLELNSDDFINFELAKYYLWYGDSLLCKEDQSNHLLTDSQMNHNNNELIDANIIIAQSETSSNDIETNNGTNDEEHSSSANVNESLGDDELAFEMLQFAIKCYNSNELTLIDAEDLSYCHMRLGDMYSLQNNFMEAEREYQLAVDIRKKFNMDSKKLSGCYLSLAQSQMFAGKLLNAKGSFKICESLMQEIVKLDPKDMTYIEALEDIKLQLNDLDRIIREQITEFSKQHGIPIEKIQLKQGSQCEAVSLIPKTTDTLDKPLLGGEAINISESKCKTIICGNKKKRVDLSNLY